MQTLFLIFIFLAVKLIVCPPVVPDDKNKEENTGTDNHDPLSDLEYHRYLKEVVNVLETDETFKKMIENATADDIKSGKIATHLDLVGHNIRTQLDEIKRKEVERLSTLISRKVKLNDIKDKREIENLLPKHLDHQNVNTFEKSDLEKLIREASSQLEQIDQKKKAEFKEHELQKEYERRKKLQELDEENRKMAENEYKKQLEKRKNHAKVNHPGSKDQLEEVWEKQDNFEDNDFDAKTFFSLHDADGDGFLNLFEIEALFLTELDKIYNSSDPNFDIAEREEEMRKMREHVLKEFDTNQDDNISFEEFLAATHNKKFDENEEWKSIEDEPQFNQKEFDEYSKAHATTEALNSSKNN